MSNEETKFIIMRKILLIFLLLPFISFSQSQEINGISFNAPNGFKKTGDLEWNKGKNTLLIGSTQVYKSGYTYTIMVTSNPDDYQALGYLIGYMTTRIQMF